MKRSFSSRILFRFRRQQSSRHSEHGALACPRGVVVFKARCCEPRETARAIPKLPVTACREVPTVITEALANAGVTIDEVDWLLLHQANIRIMESVADKLGVSFDKVLHNLSEYGNTSAGSIPLALEEAVSSGKVKKGDVIVCAGFGAGLSWGAAVLRWGEGSG